MGFGIVFLCGHYTRKPDQCKILRRIRVLVGDYQGHRRHFHDCVWSVSALYRRFKLDRIV